MRPNILEAFKTLELDETSDLQAVKTAYKKLALLHHPDRNGDEEVFKRISNAFQTLSKHFEAPAPVGRHAHYHEFDIFDLFDMMHYGMFPRFTRPRYQEANEPDSDNDDASTEYTIYSEEEASYYGRQRISHRSHTRYDSGYPHESDEQRRARAKDQLAEQAAAEERRKEEARAAKDKANKAKEVEQKEAAARRSAKTAAKRAAAKEKAEAAALQSAKRLKAKQEARSKLFTLLVPGSTIRADNDLLSIVQAAIKKDDIAMHGWEQLDNSIDMSWLRREPCKATLLHLAVKAGLLDLTVWLCNNGAILEERDDAGCAAFHHVLLKGNMSLLEYFFRSFPPVEDEDGAETDFVDMYEPPADTSLLQMVASSRNPLALKLVLANGALDDTKACYTYVEEQMEKEPEASQLWESMKAILARKGGFESNTPRSIQAGHPRSHNPRPRVSKDSTVLSPRDPASQRNAPAAKTPNRAKRAPSHSPELAKTRVTAKRA